VLETLAVAYFSADRLSAVSTAQAALELATTTAGMIWRPTSAGRLESSKERDNKGQRAPAVCSSTDNANHQASHETPTCSSAR